jgi:hypothetical protein
MTVLFSQFLLICSLLLCLTTTPAVQQGSSDQSTIASVDDKSLLHPLHLSSMEINYTTKPGTLEISCRLFTDDMEDALKKQFKVPTDLSAPAKHKAMDELLKKYIALHLKFQANGKPIALNYLGFEKDREAVIVYVESVPVKSLKKLEVYNTLMYDLFDDQTNIMHVVVNGKRKSDKLDYPEANAVIFE